MLERTAAASALRWGVRLAFAALGIGVVASLVRQVGAGTLYLILRGAAPWLPLVVALEAARVGADALATYAAYGPTASKLLPVRVLARASLVARAVSSIAPAGRTAAEATKAALLAPWAGAAAATAAAATGQAMTLVSGGIVSVPCAAAAYVISGASPITMALVVHAALLVAVGTGIRVAMRAPWLGALAGRLSRRAGERLDAVKARACETSLLPPGPIAAMLLGRAIQVAQYAILARAVGAATGVSRALVAEGASMVALALGAFVPAQVGVSEGAFAWSADVIGATLPQALAIALLAHALEAFFVAVGAVVPLVWRAPAPPNERPEH
ncbi:lysylphosphatidylglycerol synthase domain-containing protein [Polyangium sp. 6x1]|uniref:lysylphosphatidylglycerol synthase domain-containing protein n=1 Tax=Polyangium sp. 6x1 TaxID=3042689 RepID=UPI0024827067|nr:lysylphosphatidylglycerol synthase domain-containing protein [Polyangium sp. 6x1]MDI1450742.1 hypothetical protein [Polyangium sp. 6x1]